MRSAVVRVNVDPAGTLTREDYARGVRRLEQLDEELVTTPPEYMPDRNCEVEFIVDDHELDDQVSRLVSECDRAFPTEPTAGVVTYTSRGTDDDARGVLQGFDLGGEVSRTADGDHEVVTVTVSRDELDRVGESRLHTALEAALNCEVRIERV